MRGFTLAAATAIAFATTALAAPADLVPRGGLTKRTYPPTWYFPPYNGTFTPWKPVGCYSGEVALTYNTGMCSCQNAAWKAGTPMPFTMNLCFAYCKGAGFRYAGIKGGQGGKSCWCGNGVSDDDKLSNEAKCDVPCGEGEGEPGGYDVNKCGGTTTYTVYQDPCYKDYNGGEQAGNYDYVGCFYYYDGTIMPYWIGTVSDNLSVDSCLEHCASKGFAYAGMSASGAAWPIGDQCHCGGKIADHWIARHKAYPADNNGCTALCSATNKVKASIPKDDYQYCGAPWYMSIYFNPNLAEPESCDAGPPKETVTQTTPGPTPGTTTKTGSKTDTVIITTPKHETTTVTTTGTEPGTTTKTGEKTDTVVITTTPDKKTTTVTTSGEEPGTTTKTGEKTDTVVITTTADKKTTTVTTSGAEPGTTTKTGEKTDTVVITTTADKKTTTVTTSGAEPGTTTKTGEKTDTVVITTTPDEPVVKTTSSHATITITTPGPSSGTTTKPGEKTDTVIITTPTKGTTSEPEEPTGKVTVTTTTPGPTPGTTTKPGEKTDTVIITTPTKGTTSEPEEPTSKVTITTTTPGPEPGTTTKPGEKTDTVIITTPTKGTTSEPEEPTGKVTVTTTTPGPTPGTTTKPGEKTDTVIITTPTKGTTSEPEEPTGKVTITTTTPGPTAGTTTKPGEKTDTVIITTPTKGSTTTPNEPTSKVTITTTTPGPIPGTSTVPGDKTDTVIITTPTKGSTTTPNEPTSKVTITTTTPGPSPGTSTVPGDKTDTVIITTPTKGTPSSTTTSTTPEPTGPVPADSCCVMPVPASSDRKKGIMYPLGGFKPSTVSTSDKKGFTLIRLTGITTNCRTSYKYTIEEFQAACMNGCMEQQKKCNAEYASKEVCNTVKGKKTCFSKSELKTQCDTQYKACKAANTNKKGGSNPLKDAMDKCGSPPQPEDDGYYRYM